MESVSLKAFTFTIIIVWNNWRKQYMYMSPHLSNATKEIPIPFKTYLKLYEGLQTWDFRSA